MQLSIRFGGTAMTKKETSGSLLDRLVLLGWISRRSGLSLALWGPIFFGGYYLLPLLLCGIEGVLVTAPSGSAHTSTHLDGLIRAVGRHPISLPYLRDLTHLLMAALVSVGGTLCIIAIAEFMRVYNSVSDPDLIKADLDTLDAERSRMQRLVGNRRVLAPFALIAGPCGIALYYNGSADSGWWGNPQYGPAGLVLACAVSLVIFYGLHALYLLAVAQYSIARLVSNGIHLRPFHPDGCNGFTRLGNLLLLLLLLCGFCAAAAWITIWHGYLGIEEFPGIWLAAAGIVVFVPVIVIQPLVHVIIEIRRAQLLRLSPIENLLNRLLKGAEDQLHDSYVSRAKLEDMKALRDFHLLAKDIYETSVFPFNRKVASVLSVGYIVQAVALAKEIIGKFK